ncbi:MAG: nitroreductase [Candidatus Alcyoniella australis]|nr:nitroreductase [Candidatus Alcyoniella australis]
MKTLDAIRSRSSVRAFDPRQVQPELIERIIEISLQAPSACNIQPYRLALATGETWDALRVQLVRSAQSEPNAHEIPWSIRYPERYSQRQREAGFGLYKTLGIGREDHESRQRQFLHNYRGFDAPAVLFLFSDRELGAYAALDLGIWMQTFMLAAHSHGLGSVAQTSLAAYPDLVRSCFDVPDYMLLACAISFGYPKQDAKVNGFSPRRVGVEQMMLQPQERLERDVRLDPTQGPRMRRKATTLVEKALCST